MTDKANQIMTVRPTNSVESKQALPNFVGISGNTVGSQSISMNRVVIPPGATAKPHFHKGFETAIYLLAGHVETKYGEGLTQSVINHAGDFVYIPPGVPHQPINLSDSEVAIAIVARNDANEQENVQLYTP